VYVKEVKASVYDIRNSDPQPEDEYFVDTNVWYWMTYTRASIPSTQPQRYQTQQYPRFIKRALDKGTILRRCDLSLAELSGVIEECERNIFMEFVAIGEEISAKKYRHTEDEERKQVVAEIESSWNQIKGMSTCVELMIHDVSSAEALETLKNYRLDCYDVLLLQAMRKNGLQKILTDDADFATVDGIEIFTSNPALVHLAEKQSQLKTR
jgi:predicted nucleic acid-binding protein